MPRLNARFSIKYCVACHNTKAKASGLDSSLRLTLDNVDLTKVGDNAQVLERVVRKLRAGMMPPHGIAAARSAYRGLLTWLQPSSTVRRRPICRRPVPIA